MEQSEFRNPTKQNIGYVEGRAYLPEGAIGLTEDQVYHIFSTTIDNWKPSREMFTLKYGSLMLGGIASLAGGMFVTHFRKKMFIRRNALLTLAPSVFFPGMITGVSQQGSVTTKLINGELSCSVCAQVRSVSIQLLAGIVQPLLLAILSSSATAKAEATYPLPPLTDWRAILKVQAKLLRPLQMSIMGMVGLSVVNAVVVTHTQVRASEKLHKKIVEQHNIILK